VAPPGRIDTLYMVTARHAAATLNHDGRDRSTFHSGYNRHATPITVRVPQWSAAIWVDLVAARPFLNHLGTISRGVL